MSRSYRIAIRESLRRVIRAHDNVSTQLEILEVLPCDEMAELRFTDQYLAFEQLRFGDRLRVETRVALNRLLRSASAYRLVGTELRCLSCAGHCIARPSCSSRA